MTMSTATSTALSPASATPRLRLTARGRAVLAGLVVAPALLGALLLGADVPGAVAGGQASENSFSYLSVAPGESLWQLAETLAPGADPRDVISDIMRLNALDSATVLAGQQLAIPARYLP